VAFFARLKSLITPPPFRRSAEDRDGGRFPGEKDLTSFLKPFVNQLVTADSLEAPEAIEALSRIRRTAVTAGPYPTGFVLKALVGMVSPLDKHGVRARKERGYVLAADFFLQHIHRELDAVRTKSQSLGPNIFRAYCDEMVACLLDGENIRRSIEIPVLLSEEVLGSAVDCPNRSGVFLQLAQQSLASVLELTRQRYRQRATPAVHETRDQATAPTPAPANPFAVLDEAVMGYLEETCAHVEQIRAEFLACQAGPMTAGQPTGDASTAVRARLDYLHALLRIANTAQYLPVVAFLMNQVGGLVQSVHADEARGFFQRAAENYEAQGDRESALFLTKLSRMRYQQSYELFLKANCATKAAQVQSKLGPKTPGKA